MAFEMKKGSFGKAGGFGKASATPDPLAEVEYTDSLPEDCGAEFQALQKGFADRAKKEADRFQQATDSEFWFAVCFKSRDEKEAFLKAIGVRKKLMGDKYLDGRQLAKVLGVDLE